MIVIDFCNLAYTMQLQHQKENICGGRHQKTMNAWKKLLDALKSTDCTLVFFCDLNIQEAKIAEWLIRKNTEFNCFTKMYDAIENGEKSPTKIAKKTSRIALSSLFYGMEMLAKSYGQFEYSTKHEADW